MKKPLLLILLIGILMITACSKDSKQANQAEAENTEATKEESTNASTPDGNDKETNAAEATPTEEEDTTDAEDTAEENTPTDETDYSTTNTQFVASELAHLSEKDISKKWGQPTRSEEIQFRYSGTTKFVPAVVHYYQNEKYAVTFVEGKAARLVYSVFDEEILFDDEERTRALELAGLPTDIEETTDTDTAYVYNELGDIYEVTMFSKGGFVDYLYIILDEAYK